MFYDSNVYSDSCYGVPQIDCAIMVKPKKSLSDWPAMTERSIINKKFPVEYGFEKVKDEAITFALNYISEHNTKSWDNNAIFSGIMFRYPNGMVKRYDHR